MFYKKLRRLLNPIVTVHVFLSDIDKVKRWQTIIIRIDPVARDS